jgi:hypothetical protein
VMGQLDVLERLSDNTISWVETHDGLLTTTQNAGLPTDTQHHDAVGWFPLDDLPAMLGPAPRRLIETHRETCAPVLSAPQRRPGLQRDGYRWRGSCGRDRARLVLSLPSGRA